jgi:hypothetical protein
LIGFTSLLLIAFLLINPIADDGKIDPDIEFLITSSWLAESGVDIDIWIKGPGDTVVGFPFKDGRYIILERDDMGDNNDRYYLNGEYHLIERNIESISIIGIVPGEYHVSIHNYNARAEDPEEEYPTPVFVDLMDMRPYGIKMSKRIVAHFKEEVPVFSFMVDDKGNIYDISDKMGVKIRPTKDIAPFVNGNGSSGL